jgi:FkbM family methyltransferase
MFFSQQNEDKILFEKYLNYKDGFFIELGAMNGVTFSNTLFFERELNWNGILIEPTSQYNELIKNRPNCYNFNYAISELEGDIEFVGNSALGGIKSSMPDNHFYGWKLNEQSSYLVKSTKIKNIILEVNKIKKVDRVDFFSIDVEGGELEVLKTYDWTIPTYLVMIEIQNFDLIKDENCRKILADNGFEFEMSIGCNELWINKKNKI